MTNIAKTEDLVILLAVVDHGGFSAAADYLAMDVSKVSRAIARLEASLACSLLTRTTRKVALTQEGRVFVEGARAGLAQISAAEGQLRELQEAPTGLLRIDAVSPFIFHQLVPLVAEFRESYPNITLVLSSNENIIDLIEKKTDLAIRIGALHDSNLHAKALGRSVLKLVASPAYLAQHGMPHGPDDLNQHQLIGFSEPTSLNRWPLAPPRQIKPAVMASSGETIRQLTLADNGIALLSQFMIQEDLATGALIEVMPQQIVSPNDREIVQAVYYRHSTLSARISAFLAFIGPRVRL